jgi:serine phosphatase RsbU (regulator of sigma subunit)
MVPGEWICVVTDGATGATSVEGKFFGHERLRASLTWLNEVEPEQIVKKLTEDVKKFAGEADRRTTSRCWCCGGRA